MAYAAVGAWAGGAFGQMMFGYIKLFYCKKTFLSGPEILT
jgi:hypothetical protein